MSPTTTDGLPPVIACACGAWICRMSHCRPENVSVSLAGAFGRSPGCGPAAASRPPRGSWSFDAKRAVEETPSTRLPFPSLAANDVLFERATATPILS